MRKETERIERERKRGTKERKKERLVREQFEK